MSTASLSARTASESRREEPRPLRDQSPLRELLPARSHAVVDKLAESGVMTVKVVSRLNWDQLVDTGIRVQGAWQVVQALENHGRHIADGPVSRLAVDLWRSPIRTARVPLTDVTGETNLVEALATRGMLFNRTGQRSLTEKDLETAVIEAAVVNGFGVEPESDNHKHYAAFLAKDADENAHWSVKKNENVRGYAHDKDGLTVELAHMRATPLLRQRLHPKLVARTRSEPEWTSAGELYSQYQLSVTAAAGELRREGRPSDADRLEAEAGDKTATYLEAMVGNAGSTRQQDDFRQHIRTFVDYANKSAGADKALDSPIR